MGPKQHTEGNLANMSVGLSHGQETRSTPWSNAHVADYLGCETLQLAPLRPATQRSRDEASHTRRSARAGSQLENRSANAQRAQQGLQWEEGLLGVLAGCWSSCQRWQAPASGGVRILALHCFRCLPRPPPEAHTHMLSHHHQDITNHDR